MLFRRPFAIDAHAAARFLLASSASMSLKDFLALYSWPLLFLCGRYVRVGGMSLRVVSGPRVHMCVRAVCPSVCGRCVWCAHACGCCVLACALVFLHVLLSDVLDDP
jgi:hypothetical protein